MTWAKTALLLILAAVSGPSAPVSADGFEPPFVMTKPNGTGPFPAVVILHDCSGLGPRSSGAPWRWATRLTAEGYVTIWPDSFSQRNHPNGVCTDGSPPLVTYRERAQDAYAALAYLRTLPFVDGTRIAVMGGSHGGASTLATDVDSEANAKWRSNGFAAAIALYPNCYGPFGGWAAERAKEPGSPITGYKGTYKPLAPLLILSGALDDWTPAEPCRQMTDRAKAAGYPVEMIVYPDAHHSFDSNAPVRFVAERRNTTRPGGLGATTGGNAAAWADAVIRVREFLNTHLRR